MVKINNLNLVELLRGFLQSVLFFFFFFFQHKHFSSKKNMSYLNQHPVISLLRTCTAVCFDVDSTVQMDEGIDVLAEFAGKGDQVKALTASAMGGAMKFEDTLKIRLDLIQPSRKMIAECLKIHPVRFSPHLPEFVELLTKKLGKKVFLVSGGFTDMILPVADALGLPRENVFANRLLFHDDDHEQQHHQEGSYKGFDPTAFTAKSGGKAKAIQHIIENVLNKKNNKNDEEDATSTTVIMIGDGATDLEAKPPANAMIGYGGVVVREKVKKEADLFIMSFKELIDALQ